MQIFRLWNSERVRRVICRLLLFLEPEEFVASPFQRFGRFCSTSAFLSHTLTPPSSIDIFINSTSKVVKLLVGVQTTITEVSYTNITFWVRQIFKYLYLKWFARPNLSQFLRSLIVEASVGYIISFVDPTSNSQLRQVTKSFFYWVLSWE